MSHARISLAPAALLLVIVHSAPCSAAEPGVGFAGVFGDGMVIQQGKPIAVWGRAEPGESIAVALADRQARATADGTGRWSATLEPMTAADHPGELTLTASGTTAASVQRVRLGEVWIVAGGETAMRQDRTLAPAGDAKPSEAVRIFVASGAGEDVKGEWAACGDIAAMRRLPAGAVRFAHALQAARGVPVGVIVAARAHPSSPIEAWISRASLGASPAAEPILRFYEADGWNRQARESYQQKLEKWMAERQSLPLDPPPRPTPPEPFNDAHLRPASAFDALIAPIAGLAVRGIVWDHGDDEQSISHAAQHGEMLPVLIADWRSAFDSPELPFLIVQLRAQRFGKFDDRCGAELREGQARAEKLPAVASIVTADLGPSPDESRIAERLVRAALGAVYGEKSVVYRGPTLRSVTRTAKGVELRFDHAEGGLVVEGDRPPAFALAANPLRWVWADVVVEGDTVRLSAPGFASPEAVRYAYRDLPTGAMTLRNRAGLPASPFRTDTHPTFTGPLVEPDRVVRYATRKSIDIENPRLPRVLIIGDSISGGYHEPLRDLLASEANVVGESDFADGSTAWHTMGPRCYTTTGALAGDRLAKYLAARDRFDVITFNMGIHEFAGAKPGAEVAYAERLRKVVAVLRATGARVIWVSSTGTTGPDAIARFPDYLANCQRFNAAAAEVMREAGVPTADLYGLTQPRIDKLISADRIHFNDAAKREMAETIAEAVRRELRDADATR